MAENIENYSSSLGISALKRKIILEITRTNTSIRYAKENDREKRKGKKGRRRDIDRKGEIREREKERGERDIESEKRAE